MGIHIFFTAVWNGMQITRGSEYRHAIHRVSIFNLHYFISHFVLHSLLMVAYIRMEKKTFFSFARKFRQRLDSEGEVVTFSLDMTLFTASHTCDVSHV